MRHAYLRGKWLRRVTTRAAICLSIATVNSVAICDGPTLSAVAQPNGKTVVHESDFDDRSQYPGLTIVKPGVSTKAVRKQAVVEIPLNRLGPEAQKKTQAVLNNLGMYRRLPTISFECDPDVYHYFLKNPDVAVSTWRAMDISQFQLQQTTVNHYRADAGDGSVGDVELLLQTPSEILIHCEGAFKSPLLPKPIVARSLMRLQTTFAKDAEGRMIGTHSGDVFVEFPSHAVEAVAKVISPVSHNIADRNFKQMTLFVHLMSQAMARHPGWIEQIGNKLDGVPQQKKLEFLEVSARSTAESRRRMAIAAGFPTFSPEEVLTPFRQANVSTEPAGSVQLTKGSAAPATTPATAQGDTPAVQK